MTRAVIERGRQLGTPGSFWAPSLRPSSIPGIAPASPYETLYALLDMPLRPLLRFGLHAYLSCGMSLLAGCVKPNWDYDQYAPVDNAVPSPKPEPVSEAPSKSPAENPVPEDTHTGDVEPPAPSSGDSNSASTESSDSTPSSVSTTSTSSAPSTETDSTSDAVACELYQCVATNEHASAYPGHRWLNATSAVLLNATSQDRRIGRIEVVAGNGYGKTSLGIRKHESGRPGQRMGFASWDTNYQVGWQGVNLSPPVKVPAGENVWVEIDPVPHSQASITSQGTQWALWYSVDGSTNWQLQYRAVMLKVYCCRP